LATSGFIQRAQLASGFSLVDDTKKLHRTEPCETRNTGTSFSEEILVVTMTNGPCLDRGTMQNPAEPLQGTTLVHWRRDGRHFEQVIESRN
jgi:hypothetical protein